VRAVALTGLGQIALYRGEMKLAARYMKESLRLLREFEHTPSLIFLLLGLGDLERSQGHGEAAIAYYEQCLALTRTANDKVSMAGALFGLGDVAREQQKYARACMLLKQSIQLAWDVGDRLGMVATLETFAWLSRQIGLPERAAQFLGTVEGLRDWLQIPLPPTFHTNHEHEVAVLRNELGESLFHELWAYGRTMTLKLALSMVARISVPEQSDTPTGKEAPTYPAGLTAREVDVLRLVAAGLPDARIAEQLVISPRTVNTHLRSIYAKLGVSSRSAATRFAFEQNLV
jgi:ATP/maltotriose-dependent transcriptional regulator MalT